MATELLNQRIKDIMCLRYKQGYADTTPTLVDIERTHILFVNCHYKPFAALGYEYNKTKTSSGTPVFGGQVQFSIPQFGDFFYDMVVHFNLDAISCNVAVAGNIPAFPPYIGSQQQNTSATQSTSAAVSSGPPYTYYKYTYQYVNLNGTVVNQATATSQNFVRYCEYPGERMFTDVQFQVNGNPLDEYEINTSIFNRKFRVPPGKLIGYQRLMGQEYPKASYTDLLAINGTSPWNSEALAVVNGSPATAAPANASDTARFIQYVLDGYQTPQATQPALDCWVPLLFWFNRDVRLSIPSVAIPYGQRFITISLNTQANLVYVAAGNLFLQLTTEAFDSTSATAPSNTTAGLQGYRRYVTRQPVIIPSSVPSSTQTINTFDLYINNIFVNPEIHDIYIKRIGFSLIRVYRFQIQNQNTPANQVLLSQLKWPIESMFCALQPVFNITNPVYGSSWPQVTSGDPRADRDWHRMTVVTDNSISRLANEVYPFLTTTTGAATPDSASAVGPLAGGTNSLMKNQFATELSTYQVLTPTFTTIQIQAHGINIYDQYNAPFFSDYLPYIYGGYNIVTPDDQGCVLVNFNLYPGTYQPSGHLNVSRAREFYFNYSSLVCSTSNPCNLIVVAICLNFLLISDGSAVLRYST